MRYHGSATLIADIDTETFYSEVMAAADSSCDFSSRWYIVNGRNKGK